MNLKQKMKTYSFWMALTGAVILVLQTIGKECGFSIDDKVITGIVSSVCGVFIVLGIISKPSIKNEDCEKTTKDATEDTMEKE